MRVHPSGEQLGYQRGEANLLLLSLAQEFGPGFVDVDRERIGSADPQQLGTRLPRVRTADTLEIIFSRTTPALECTDLQT